MSITIQDLLTLKSTQHFTLVAGKGGLQRPVKMADMLDFGWDREKEYSSAYMGSKNLFDEASFVISSLMFANGNPGKLYETILRLIQCGVSGLAFKTAFLRHCPRRFINWPSKTTSRSFGLTIMSPTVKLFVIFLMQSNSIRTLLLPPAASPACSTRS